MSKPKKTEVLDVRGSENCPFCAEEYLCCFMDAACASEDGEIGADCPLRSRNILVREKQKEEAK